VPRGGLRSHQLGAAACRAGHCRALLLPRAAAMATGRREGGGATPRLAAGSACLERGGQPAGEQRDEDAPDALLRLLRGAVHAVDAACEVDDRLVPAVGGAGGGGCRRCCVHAGGGCATRQDACRAAPGRQEAPATHAAQHRPAGQWHGCVMTWGGAFPMHSAELPHQPRRRRGLLGSPRRLAHPGSALSWPTACAIFPRNSAMIS
jgi:hypothetical protein